MTDKAVVIIPARYGSCRLPGKALADIGDEPMIVRVYKRAREIPDVDAVLVATDDARIARAVEGVGGRVVMTRADHASGTDRIAEASQGLGAEIIVNVQGDLPFLDPRIVRPLIERLRDDPGLPMATVMTPISDATQLADPSVVKVVVDSNGDAIAFFREPPDREASRLGHHIGLYAYRSWFLSTFSRTEKSAGELKHGLEQLRALENGHRIGVVEWAGQPILEVNTSADLERARVHEEHGGRTNETVGC